MTLAVPGPAEPVLALDRAGRLHERVLPAHAHRALFARLLLGAATEEWVHVWPAQRTAEGKLIAYRRQPRAWLAGGPLDELLARTAAWEARDLEVFAGLLPRSRADPSAKAVVGGDRVWVDVDGGVDRLEAFCERHPPHYRGRSGGPGDGQHAVWRLDRRHPPAELAAVNRRLAQAVGGDAAVCFAAASLRLPGTRNHKPGGGWCRILTIDAALEPYRLEALTGGLPEVIGPLAASSVPPRAARNGAPRRVDALAAIPPPAYVAALCGVPVPEAGGVISCPLPGHADEHPSCRVGADPREGWRCFSHPGGPVGGRIYDLASALIGGPVGSALRGPAFLHAREHLLERLARVGPA